jgi:hypothetical protein
MRAFFLGALSSLVLGSCASVSLAQDGADIVRVEEDWVMQINQPDGVEDSPQLSTWMSPTDNLDGQCFSVDFNHAQRPDFSAGGFQTKAMVANELHDDVFSENGDNLVVDNETVSWTQVMALHGNHLIFAVKNGSSQSWGAFGGMYTVVRFHNPSVENLNDYSPEKSAEWSGIGYGKNRVNSLQITEVRYYTADGSVITVSPNLDVD